MSDYDDSMQDYDWYQNTGELGEYFEADRPSFQNYGNYGNGNNGGNDDGGGACITGCLAVLFLVVFIGLVYWFF